MPTHDQRVEIPVEGGLNMPGTLVSPTTLLPGVLFLQGWGSGQEQYLPRARQIAALGCLCLTFEPRGVARADPLHETVTRADNLRDVLAAYDMLARRPSVDAMGIGVVGASYGAYLACILASLRPVRWLALRAPALYKDGDWTSPKRRLNRDELAAYRRRPIDPTDNRALAACARFRGDVLIVESEQDEIVPHPAVANYLAAFGKAQSLTYRVLQGADHALTGEAFQQAYTSLLVSWTAEMVLGKREGASAPAAKLRAGDASLAAARATAAR